MQLLFATQNQNKLREVEAILDHRIQVISLNDMIFSEELPETHDTIEENAAEKAEFVFHQFGINCFAEDTGLEIETLNGEPGVYSARYAGEGKNAADNIRLVLQKMDGKKNRKARFRTVICLILGGSKLLFEGIAAGIIADSPRGKSGFGYDPIFIPDGFTESFGEMNFDLKNKISHRTKAFQKMSQWLEENLNLL